MEVRETFQLERITSLKVALSRALELKLIKEQNRNSISQQNTKGSQKTQNFSINGKNVEKQNQPFNHQE